jgi:hypothetical protein
MKKTLILAAATLLAGVASSSAIVTPQAWYHFADPANPQDSSGNARHFTGAYSHVPPNNPAYGGSFSGIITPTGVGGPLGTSGYTSAACTRAGWYSTRICTTWGTGYNPPLTNFSIEISVQPYGRGFMGGSAWLFSSGRNNGSYLLRVKDNGDGTSSYVATIQGYGDIGSPMPIDTNRWTHLAMVNDNGVTTFYTNGVPCGLSDTNHATIASSGDMYIGNPDAWQGPDGLLDEARICTFAPGEFSTSDLLIKPPGPFIVSQPQNATVWAGGAVPFSVGAVIDPALTYQWRRNGANIAGATQAAIFIPLVAASDNGHTFACVVTSGSLSVTSVTATLTVVTPNAANVNAYRTAITSEPSLVAYFPVDGSTGTTVANTKDASRNGTLEAKATYEGRTNRAFGERALAFNADGEVQVPNHPAFDIGAGSGTVEAVIYMDAGAVDAPSILALGWDATAPYCSYGTTSDGLSLVYKTDAAQATWPLTPTLIGRRAHIAFVVLNGINVTAYVDGQSQGTKALAGSSTSMLAPAWIGAGSGSTLPVNRFAGDIDELAIYSSALSQSTIQSHYSKYLFGTNTAPPTIVSQPVSKTLFAGGSPQLVVVASGTLPLSYQWFSNSVPIPGATTATLNLRQTTAAFTAAYSLTIANAFGTTNTTPINLTFVIPPAGYATTIMGDHPMAYYRLDETSGSTAADSAGMNNATYSGSMTLGVGGMVASDAAVNFTGGNAQAPWSTTLNNPAGPFTAELWIKPNDTALAVPLSSQNRITGRSGYALYQNNGGDNFVADLGLVGQTGVYRWTATPGPKVGQWMHVVLTSDGVTVNLYTDGVLKATDTGFVFGTDIMANVGEPLFIGVRNGGGFPYNGIIDDVVIYDYALTQTQVTNHWSAIWSPAVVVTPPASITTNEWSTLTLAPTVTGLPNTYQWQKNNVNLVPVNNPDGTAHYPSGVTSPTLVIAQAHPADNGQYRLVINNPVGGATSSPATVTITADTTKPTVNRIIGLGTPNGLGGPTPYLVRIDFSERVDSTTGAIPGNYVFNGGATVGTVQVSADSTKAFVSTGGLTPGQKYSVTVSGVTDQAQTPNTIQTVTKTFWVPLLAQGLLWDFYPNVTPQAVDSLLINLYFPNAPYTNLGTATFDSTPITGGNLNNRPAFAGIGENYGSSLSGWITPTVTTNYYFYLASDDASRLLLSSSADPALAVPIAEEIGYGHGFQEPGNPTTSYAVPLLAGQSYFIRALQTEGGGGDYVKVAWKMEGDPTASTNLVPISGSVLRAYVPLAPPTFTSITKPGGQVVIAWTGFGILLESTDLKTWTPVPGNPTSPYSVTPSLPQKYFRVEQ